MDYNVSLQTIAWFNSLNNSEVLEISPKFQRRAVWTDKERSELLATICESLPFPEIYIQVVTDSETGVQKYIIVDGQQRITSILKFINGEVSLPNTIVWDGKYFRELEDENKKKFWQYQIVVRNLSNTSDAEIRDLFSRLNTNNIALNDQELRNARYTGKFKQAVERFADNPFFQSIGLFTPREIRRMEDVEYVGELLLRVVIGITNKKDLLDDVYENYNDDFPNEAQFELDFNAALTLVRQIVTLDNQVALKTKSNFYSVFGVCLTYYRTTKRLSFQNSDAVAKEIGELLIAARNSRSEDREQDAIVADYFDAVSRAASDKSRRAKREDILMGIIKSCEKTTLTDD